MTVHSAETTCFDLCTPTHHQRLIQEQILYVYDTSLATLNTEASGLSYIIIVFMIIIIFICIIIVTFTFFIMIMFPIRTIW